MTRHDQLPAGDFAHWYEDTLQALANDGPSEVPCGECNACCRSSFFIHLSPEETETLAQIPADLLFPAPGLSAGNVLLGYAEDGCCPMLREGACSIYEYRPRTCRAFDCRVFSAAGVEADKPLIREQVGQWQFSYSRAGEHDLHAAVRSAAGFLETHPSCFPGGLAPANPLQVALAALEVSHLFREADARSDADSVTADDAELVSAVLEARARREDRHDGRGSWPGGGSR